MIQYHTRTSEGRARRVMLRCVNQACWPRWSHHAKPNDSIYRIYIGVVQGPFIPSLRRVPQRARVPWLRMARRIIEAWRSFTTPTGPIPASAGSPRTSLLPCPNGTITRTVLVMSEGTQGQSQHHRSFAELKWFVSVEQVAPSESDPSCFLPDRSNISVPGREG